MLATSSTSPGRGSGVHSPVVPLNSGESSTSCTSSVRIGPGRILLTRTHEAPEFVGGQHDQVVESRLRDAVGPEPPVGVAGGDRGDADEGAPPPRTISRAECLSTYIEPFTLRSTVARQPSESIWVIGPIVREPPAQCTTPCRRPFPR